MYKNIFNKDINYFNGTVGPNFYLPNTMAKKIYKYGCYKFMPTNKNEACGMERIWPVLANDVGSVAFTEQYTGNEKGFMGYIIKHYLCRE